MIFLGLISWACEYFVSRLRREDNRIIPPIEETNQAREPSKGLRA